MYWLDKINLFKRSSLYDHGNIAISNYLLKTLQFSLLIYAAAWFFFECMKNNKFDIIMAATVAVAFLYTVFFLIAPRPL